MQPEIFGEGTHFMIPWLERPEIFSVRVKTRSIGSLTSTKGVSLFFPFFFFAHLNF
jgi:prohibitin 2